MSLPTDDAARKNIPIHSGVLMYFPDAIAAVAELSRIGNEQHNPGEPLHWNRDKSTDDPDAMVRHLLDHASGVRVRAVDENGQEYGDLLPPGMDSDGVRHLAKAAWRALATLQKAIEAEREHSGVVVSCSPIEADT